MKTTLNRNLFISLIIFVLLFSAGLLNIRYYPMDFDDRSEKIILWSNIRDYYNFFGSEAPVPPILEGFDIPYIHESIEKDHGIAALYPVAPFLTMDDKYTVGFFWHLYLYAFFCLGTVFMYKSLRRLLQNRFVSYFGTLMYFLSPRLYGDSLHNNKDIIFLSLLTIVLYFTISMSEEDKKRNAVLFAIFGGLFCNTRVLGLYFTAVFGFIYILILTLRHKWSKEKFINGLIAAFGSLSVYIIVTPAIYAGGGFDLIGHISYCVNRTSNFVSWWHPVLFDGHVYDWRFDVLPWYYIPKFILITTPPIVIVLFFIGLISICVRIRVKKDVAIYALTMLITGIIPLLVAIVKKSILYNGWRHFYFLYCVIIIISSAGLKMLTDALGSKEKFSGIKARNLKYLLYLICSATALFYYIGDAYYQVGGAMYYNILAGGSVPMRYEMDYSAISGKEVLRHWIGSVDEEHVFLFMDGDDISAINNCFSVMDDDIRDKVTLVNTRDLAVSLAEEGYTVYEYFDPVYAYWNGGDRWSYVSTLENVYTYKPWGRTSGAIYKFSE